MADETAEELTNRTIPEEVRNVLGAQFCRRCKTPFSFNRANPLYFCHDCRADDSREQDGWTPENSRD